MKAKGLHNMKNKIMTLALINAFAVSAVAGHSIDFVRQMSDGIRGTFTCDCYSTRKIGAGKMTWFPSPACWIDSPHTSRTCKVWAIMPLRKVEQNSTLPIWHYSQKPQSHLREQSARYQFQYLGAIAESNAAYGACIENVFDVDAGDLFRHFGRDSKGVEAALVSEWDLDATNDTVQCSSGRIGIDDGRSVLMYGLTLRPDGECCFRFSVNGMGDIHERIFYVKDGKLFDSGRRLIESRPDVVTSSPGSSIWLSGRDTVSLRISYDYKILREPEARNSDILISLGNLLSISDWLSQPQVKRGSWQANGNCSLDKRQIF